VEPISCSSSNMSAPVHEMISEGVPSDAGLHHAQLSPAESTFQDHDPWQGNVGLKAFADGLTRAARAVFPSKPPRSQYAKIYVLMLRWEDEPAYEVSRLLKTFEETFHFDVEMWKIPSKSSQEEMNEKIKAFVNLGDNSPEDLKILHYAGQSQMNKNHQLLLTRYTPPF
jgi:hypothetical protein